MAQANEIDREAVKVLAIAVGVREAARQLGLSEERVMKWSQRGHWLTTEVKPQPPTVTRNDVRTVRRPSEVLLSALKSDSDRTKLGLSKAARKAAETFAGMGGDKLCEPASALSASKWAGTAETVHAWRNVEQVGSATPPLSVYAKQAIIAVSQH